MRKIQISSLEPCYQNWHKMPSTQQQGRYSDICKKYVFDFTKKSDNEIVEIFNKNKKLCTCVNKNQLNQELIISPEKKSFWRIIFLLITFLGVGNYSVNSQIMPLFPKSPITYYEKKEYSLENLPLKKHFPKGISSISILRVHADLSSPYFHNSYELKSAIVLDKNNLPISGIYVVNIRTANGVITDKNGSFSILSSSNNVGDHVSQKGDVLICINHNLEIIDDTKILVEINNKELNRCETLADKQ
jgi:hypothetical protein